MIYAEMFLFQGFLIMLKNYNYNYYFKHKYILLKIT